MGIFGCHGNEPENGLVVGVAEPFQIGILPVAGQGILGEIVGAHTEKVYQRCQQVADHCGGRGKIIEKSCPKCGGRGYQNVSKTVEIQIPAGIDDGQTLSVRGQGNAGANGGPAGDLLVMVTVRPDSLFTRKDYDIYCEMPVSFYQAVTGDELTVPTIDGNVKYNLPAGTQPGTVFRLRGKGVQRLNGRGRGDQYVTVTIDVPKNLTRAQLDKLKEFDDAVTDKQTAKKKKFSDKIKEMFEGRENP